MGKVIISDELIASNKDTFLSILKAAISNRDGSLFSDLVNYLEANNFFESPASTKYHGAVKGGLCDHSLCVYYNLKSLVASKHLGDVISDDSIAIVALLHDIAKAGSYEIDFRNVKVYDQKGDKFERDGRRYYWESVPFYKLKDAEYRFIYGNHEETCEYLVRRFIPLKLEESVAILLHHSGMGWDSVDTNVVSDPYNKYPLAALLHMADFIATFIDKS